MTKSERGSSQPGTAASALWAGSGNLRQPWRRHLATAVLVILLTALTQIGGLIWLASRLISGRLLPAGVLALSLYAALTAVVIPPIAGWFGRVRLPCFDDDSVIAPAGPLACALNRNYLRPELMELLKDLGADMAQRFPGSRVTTLEAGFPFINGFPILPHLSHRDGRKVDIAFFYRDSRTNLPIGHGSPSPFGYFLYEQPRMDEIPSCRGRWAPLRWDFDWLQPEHPTWKLDEPRTAAVLAWLQADPRISKIFVEPYLAQRLHETGGKIRFQGCRAARHDDHIHIEASNSWP